MTSIRETHNHYTRYITRMYSLSLPVTGMAEIQEKYSSQLTSILDTQIYNVDTSVENIELFNIA